jgi:hypothetical protein
VVLRRNLKPFRYAASGTIEVLYGHEIKDDGDDYMLLIKKGIHAFDENPMVGIFDYFPFCEYSLLMTQLFKAEIVQ